MLGKGSGESWGRGRRGGRERRRERDGGKIENEKTAIYTSKLRLNTLVSTILPKREEEIQIGESMYIRRVAVSVCVRYMQQLARSV